MSFRLSILVTLSLDPGQLIFDVNSRCTRHLHRLATSDASHRRGMALAPAEGSHHTEIKTLARRLSLSFLFLVTRSPPRRAMVRYRQRFTPAHLWDPRDGPFEHGKKWQEFVASYMKTKRPPPPAGDVKVLSRHEVETIFGIAPSPRAIIDESDQDAETNAYSIPPTPPILPPGAYTPLQNRRPVPFSPDVFDHSYHPDPPRPCPPVYSETDPLPYDGNLLVCDHRTGRAAPGWTIEWLRDAHATRHLAPFLPYSTCKWSKKCEEYRWVHGMPLDSTDTLGLDWEWDDEEKEEGGEDELYPTYADNPRYLVGGRKVTLFQLKSMAWEWWDISEELSYCMVDGLSDDVATELSAYCKEEAGE